MSLQGQCWLIHSFSFACPSIFYFTCILIRLNDVSLNCVVICRAFIFQMPKMYDFHCSNAKYMNPSRETSPLKLPHQCDSEGGRIRGALLYKTKYSLFNVKLFTTLTSSFEIKKLFY